MINETVPFLLCHPHRSIPTGEPLSQHENNNNFLQSEWPSISHLLFFFLYCTGCRCWTAHVQSCWKSGFHRLFNSCRAPAATLKCHVLGHVFSSVIWSHSQQGWKSVYVAANTVHTVHALYYRYPCNRCSFQSVFTKSIRGHYIKRIIVKCTLTWQLFFKTYILWCLWNTNNCEWQ